MNHDEPRNLPARNCISQSDLSFPWPAIVPGGYVPGRAAPGAHVPASVQAVPTNVPMVPAPLAAPPPMVTQAMLAKYTTLQEMERQKDALRREITERLQKGAAIEPGEYTAAIHETSSRRFTTEKLLRILGHDWVEWLKSQIVPTESRQLHVTRSR